MKACGQAPGSVLIAINRDHREQTFSIPVTATALIGCTTLTPSLGDARVSGPKKIAA